MEAAAVDEERRGGRVGDGRGGQGGGRDEVDDGEPGHVGDSRKEQDEKRLASGFQRK